MDFLRNSQTFLFLQVCLAHRIINHLSKDHDPSEAADSALDYMNKRVGGSGGAVVVDKHGRYQLLPTLLSTHSFIQC